jgi:hypothetical protein
MNNKVSNDISLDSKVKVSIGKKHKLKIRKKLHLIIYTDSLKKSDLNTFANASETLKKDYLANYDQKFHKVSVRMVYSGKEMVELINNCEDNSIASLDVVSHGNQGGLHISRKLSQPLKAGLIQKLAHVKLRENSDNPQSEEDAEYIEESMHGIYSGYLARKIVSYYFNQTFSKKEKDGKSVSNRDTVFISKIQFDKFDNYAYVEFHGCKTAEYIEWLNDVVDNFAENFSEKLSKNSIVLGHITSSSPDKNPNGNPNDYRYGKIRTYIRGKLDKDSVERWGLKFKNSSTPP